MFFAVVRSCGQLSKSFPGVAFTASLQKSASWHLLKNLLLVNWMAMKQKKFANHFGTVKLSSNLGGSIVFVFERRMELEGKKNQAVDLMRRVFLVQEVRCTWQRTRLDASIYIVCLGEVMVTSRSPQRWFRWFSCQVAMSFFLEAWHVEKRLNFSPLLTHFFPFFLENGQQVKASRWSTVVLICTCYFIMPFWPESLP